MTNRSKRSVLSDVDGTLIDSNYFHTLSWRQALRQSGITTPTAAIHPAVGMGGQELLHHLLGSNTAPEQVDALIEADDAMFSTHGPAMVLYDAAKELLEHYDAPGAAVVLAASAQESELNVLRKALDAELVTAAATSSSDASRGKPSPDIRDAVWDAEAPGAAEVSHDVQELLENMDHSAQNCSDQIPGCRATTATAAPTTTPAITTRRHTCKPTTNPGSSRIRDRNMPAKKI